MTLWTMYVRPPSNIVRDTSLLREDEETYALAILQNKPCESIEALRREGCSFHAWSLVFVDSESERRDILHSLYASL
jgi:hypothetical protein